ncbi:unnamed protein product, partial [Ectocarpus sp. 13 AM-2016]
MQELYKVYVKERKNSVAVELSYPSERYQISRPRGQVLYYIAGWAASKALTHQARHNLSQDWVRVVQHNTRRSSREAIFTNVMLRDFVAGVDQKNDLKNGPGLLYP